MSQTIKYRTPHFLLLILPKLILQAFYSKFHSTKSNADSLNSNMIVAIFK